MIIGLVTSSRQGALIRLQVRNATTDICRLREQVLRELGFRDILKKMKDEENAKVILLFPYVVNLNDAIDDPVNRLENLVRSIFAGNIFDLGSAHVIYIAMRMQIQERMGSSRSPSTTYERSDQSYVVSTRHYFRENPCFRLMRTWNT